MNMQLLWAFLGDVTVAVALVGAAYAVLAGILAWRFMRDGFNPIDGRLVRAFRPVTIFKPLHLNEPGLFDNLETFFCQDYPASVQIVFGVQDKTDPALRVVKALQAKYPQRDIVIVADTAVYGANAKVSNLINMFPAARHNILVLSDSDIAVPENWLKVVTAALDQPGVGLVTCHYTGRTLVGEQRLWPILSAMGRSYEFLPNAVLADSLGLAAPCFGSTIAFKRQTLDEIGGFSAFANFLADDYEMGRTVRAKGYTIAIPALGVDHTAAEASVTELFRHELRWARTVRVVNPMGHLGSVVTFGFPFALMSVGFLRLSFFSLGVLAATFAARLFLKYCVDGAFGTNSGPYWLLPLRDLLSFVVFQASLFGGTVHWRAARFKIVAASRSMIASSASQLRNPGVSLLRHGRDTAATLPPNLL
jgi:ceramide glucosyltransferase